MKKRLVVGISGGSGIPLATELLSQLRKIEEIETHLAVSYTHLGIHGSN